MVFSKIAATVVVAVLCLFFGAYGQVGKESGGAVDVTAGGIQVGQMVPDVLVSEVHNYRDASGKVSDSFRLSDFKGKLLILDFWATWCAPCVAMIPKMDSLQKAFSGKLALVSLTYQSEDVVLPFLKELEKRRGMKDSSLPVVTGSKELHQLFPHVTLPHYVWISGDGKVLAVTGMEEVNAVNIERMIGEGTALRKKVDRRLSHDPKIPLLANGNGGDGSNLLSHSLLTGYTEGLPSGYSVGKGRVTCTNLSMLQLFRLAYGGRDRYIGWNKLVLQTTAKELRAPVGASGMDYRNWLAAGKGFCYEIIGEEEGLFLRMQEDLKRYFPDFDARMQQVKTDALVLRRTSGTDRLSSAGGTVRNDFSAGAVLRNSSLDVLVSRLESGPQQRSALPLVNGTGFGGRVDLELNGRLSDLQVLNGELSKYDLKFSKQRVKTALLVVSDRKDSKFNSRK